MNQKRGFTLIELLVVVVIVGIIATLTVPRLTNQAEKGNVMEAVTFLGLMRKGQVQMFNENRTYVFLPQGFPTSPSGITFDDDLARRAWARLGMTPPNYTRPNSVWIYGAFDISTATPGRVYAVRVFPGTINEKDDTTPLGMITLDANGTWGGTGSYRQSGGPYAPRR